MNDARDLSGLALKVGLNLALQSCCGLVIGGITNEIGESDGKDADYADEEQG